ncbi:MAG TPA: 50S ribosomal protein L23 [Candidatus Paceibacterota bacterium]|nr:50S ribosomal protein L23 [Candidatus Paceibacterota bacterium]
MALFSKTTNTKKPAAAKSVDTKATAEKSNMRSSHAGVLRHARITEKATMHSMESVYVFDVAPNATKRDIVMAIRDIYNVTPRMVRVAAIPTKTTRNMRTGVSGLKRGGKKAYVYLKKGETIIIA